MTPDSGRDAVRDAIRLADLHAAARGAMDPDQPQGPKPQPAVGGEGSSPVRGGGPARPDAAGTILVPGQGRPSRPA